MRAVAEISDLRAELQLARDADRKAQERQTQAASQQNAEILDRLDAIQRQRDVSVWDGFAQVRIVMSVCPINFAIADYV